MLKYLVILLDNTSVSYCHYVNEYIEQKLIDIDILKAGILFAMKENLMVQFVYPKYDLPEEYKEIIDTVDHCKIVPLDISSNADVVVFGNVKDIQHCQFNNDTTLIFRTLKDDFFNNISFIKDVIAYVKRLNVVIIDVEKFTKVDFDKYKYCLDLLSQEVERLYLNNSYPQLNLLTDRMMLTSMNNCNAGFENITLAPDGNFYVCPAFYQADSRTIIEDKQFSIGDIHGGLDIKNLQLYRLSHAPICRNCDAFQCKRCIWLNRKMTLQVNTPSHEQCVISHLERNASMELLNNIRKHGAFMPEIEINEVPYLDPFDMRKEW